MAYVKLAKTVSASIVQNVGSDPDSGKALTKTVGISGLDADPDADKLMAVVTKIVPVLLGTNARTELRETSTIESE